MARTTTKKPAAPPVEMSAAAKKTRASIRSLAEQVLTQINRKKNPTLMIPSRSLANAYFDEKKRIIQLGKETTARSFFNASMAKKFMQTFLVADACRELVESMKTTSIRDLYYMTKHSL